MQMEVPVTSSDLLVEAFGRIPDLVHGAIDGLTPDQLTARLDGEANSIAWLVWHLSRIADDHVADVAGSPKSGRQLAGRNAGACHLTSPTPATDIPPNRLPRSPATPRCCAATSTPCMR